ncbi:MAG TPA: peptidylprolyl isomerase [Roseiflexaceae bacterium]|nr:peptidylprolyl isomerase [Roseiflexaceae bacterium]
MSQSSQSRKNAPPPRQNPLPAILSALVVVAIFVTLGLMLASNRPGANPSAAAPTEAGFEPAPTAAAPAAGEPTPAAGAAAPAGRADAYSAPPPMAIDPNKAYTATFTTPRGDFVVKLRPDLAPQTVNSFVFLAREGFYNGVTWHRVLPNFMAQGGDPTGTGTGGPGYTVPDEFTDKVKFDKPGILAMANTGQPNSGGSQFFVTTAPADYLDGKYTIFGEVQQGQEIVNAIPLRDPEQNPTTPGEQIVKITIDEK